MVVDINQIKVLREETGVSVADCKKALLESNGDMDVARAKIKARGATVAQKKFDRQLSSGCFECVKYDWGYAIMGVACETDFVASSDAFLSSVRDIIGIAESRKLTTLDAILESDLVIKERESLVHKFGENLRLAAFYRVHIDKSDVAYVYKHGRGREISVVVLSSIPHSFDKSEAMDAAKDVAMHVLALDPPYIYKTDMPEEMLDSMKKAILKDVSSDKPAYVLDRIVSGKMSSFYKENCLVEQDFVKDEEITISDYLERVFKGVPVVVKIAKKYTM